MAIHPCLWIDEVWGGQSLWAGSGAFGSSSSSHWAGHSHSAATWVCRWRQERSLQPHHWALTFCLFIWRAKANPKAAWMPWGWEESHHTWNHRQHLCALSFPHSSFAMSRDELQPALLCPYTHGTHTSAQKSTSQADPHSPPPLPPARSSWLTSAAIKTKCHQICLKVLT